MTQQPKMQTAHTDLPELFLYVKHIISLTWLHFSGAKKEKKGARINESHTYFLSSTLSFFLTKSKHGKADSQAKHHGAPHHDCRQCQSDNKKTEIITIWSQLDQKCGIYSVEIRVRS